MISVFLSDGRKWGRRMLPKDPVMLLSAVNLKLRDYYGSVEEMCDDMDEDLSRVTQILAQIDYHYDREKNQFV